VPLFRRKPKLKQEHKIMQQAEQAAGALLPEYHRATAECPHPERWSMYDSMTAEYEVLEFLRTLVTTLKPDLVVETGDDAHHVTVDQIIRALSEHIEAPAP